MEFAKDINDVSKDCAIVDGDNTLVFESDSEDEALNKCREIRDEDELYYHYAVRVEGLYEGRFVSIEEYLHDKEAA